MKSINFKFYSVLKNEDAVPYIGGNLLVAADGLGGSGSAVHQIDRTKHADMHDEILSGAFGDIGQISSELSQYIEELIAPMSDEQNDTSALWASRIVIARCVYALTEGEFKEAKLSDKKVRAKLAEFIGKGLHDTVEKFDLKKGKYDNQILLPTTLVFIRYFEENHSVIAEAVWAGDSRLYALTPSGLKLLSVDDEDGSGSVTNLFYADNQKIRLNYLRYEIQEPCILMAVSDGVFEPFGPHDHLGVEHTLLSAISESNSEQELADKLHDFYDGVHGDDATMAFVSLGFADFADMKKALKKRTDKILAIRQKQEELYSALEVVNLSEEDAAHYVASRTADRYDYIISTLLDAMERETEDIAITTEIRSIAENAQRAYKTALETAVKEKRELALAELNKFVLSYPEVVVPEILTDRSLTLNDRGLEQEYIGFKQTANDLALQLKRGNDEMLQEQESALQRQTFHERVQEKIAEYRKLFDEMWNVWDPEVVKNRERVLDILVVWCRIDNSLKFGWVLQDIGKLPSSDRDLACAIRDFNSNCRKWQSNKKERQAATDKSKNNYERVWKRLFEYFKRDEQLPFMLLSPEAIQRFGFNLSDKNVGSDAKIDRNSLIRELKAEKPAVVPCIVRALAVGCDKTSIIDSQYNTTKLGLFRTYYQLKNNPDNGIKEFGKELLELESEYTSLVDNAKF